MSFLNSTNAEACNDIALCILPLHLFFGVDTLLKPSSLRTRASNLFLAEGHTRYCVLWSWAAGGKITLSDVPNRPNYYVIFTVYAYDLPVLSRAG